MEKEVELIEFHEDIVHVSLLQLVYLVFFRVVPDCWPSS